VSDTTKAHQGTKADNIKNPKIQKTKRKQKFKKQNLKLRT
jgi:hypothetical protein